MENIKGWTVTDVGVFVTVEEYGDGVVAFVGRHVDNGKPRLGIKLSGPNGKHNGTVKGSTYFKCDQKYGVLVVPGKVSRQSTGPSSSETAISAPAPAPNPSTWQSKLDRAGAEQQVRARGIVGGFIARPSPRSPAGWAVTVLTQNDGIVHLSVTKDEHGGLRFNTSKSSHPTIEALIHFNTNPSTADTPVPLVYPTTAQVNASISTGPSGEATGSSKGSKSSKGKGSSKASPSSKSSSGKKKKSSKGKSSAQRVELTKLEGQGLGMTLAQGTPHGTTVTKVKPDSVAAASGQIHPGMHIKSVNGTDVSQSTKADCIAAIKASPSKIVFEFIPTAEVPQFDGVPGNDTAGYQVQIPEDTPMKHSEGTVPEDDPFDSMRRLELIKYLRDAGLDYRQANNPDELKTMAREHARTTGTAPTVKSAPSKPAPTAPIGDEFADMKRLQLIKLLREKKVDYSAAKNVEELRELARSISG